MKCINHPDKDALSVCAHCGKNVCSDCSVQIKEEFYCKDCVAKKVQGGGVKDGRSAGLALILSLLVPGLGQFYNGQPGKGLLIFLFGWLVIPWIIGIVDAYRVAQKINAGTIQVTRKTGCLIAFVIGVFALFFVIFILALLLAIAIPNVIRAGITANETQAQTTLKTISTAMEGYSAANNGTYPKAISELTKTNPAYLTQDYTLSAQNGYVYRVEPVASGYKIVAKPVDCNLSGVKVFTIETGGVLSFQDCQSDAR